MTNRNITSSVVALLAGAALWFLPDHVRGLNTLFAMNGTLLPASALALIFGLSLLDLATSYQLSGPAQLGAAHKHSILIPAPHE